MLRTTCPNISIITNFGCHANCWYCIWKGHPLEDVKRPTNWDKLEEFLFKYKEKGKISVSGGGDSLYNYSENINWWNKFFTLTKKFNLLVDIHTREKFKNNIFWAKINRVSFSSDDLKFDQKYLEYLSSKVKLRIVHLVTANSTNEKIKKYFLFQKEIKCQFTIKELVGYNDNGKYKLFKKIFPNIFYLDSGDYNIYYMPDNNVKTNFLGGKE